MCGITACISKSLTKKHEDVLEDLLVVDSLRGKDSTGVAFIKSNLATTLIKKTLLPQDLFDMGQYTKAKSGINKVIVGHNRATSVGGTSNATAHPFEFDNLVGVHNGTLIGWNYGYSGLNDSNQFTVDSECLYHNISTRGIDEVWKVLDGSAALVWWDKTAEILNLLRNKERPLSMVATEDGAIFIASEAWMLSVCLGRNGIKHGDIVDIAPNKLVSINLNMEVVTRDVEAKKPSPVTVVGGTANSKGTDKKLVGKEVNFEVVSLVSTSKNGTSYRIEGETLTKKKKKVFFYLDSVSHFDLYKRLRDSISTFTGKINYVNYQGYHLAASSIVEDDIPYADLDNPKDDMCTCAWCTDTVEKKAAKQIGNSEYICPQCVDLPDVQTYLLDYIK